MKNQYQHQKAFLDDYGIRSLEFGTWGVFDYNSSLGLNYLKSEKSENDQSKERSI
jgi:hypothetical protein